MDFPPDGMSVAASCIGRRRSSCIARRRFSTAASLFPFGSRFVNSLPGDPITDARLRKVDAAYSFASPSPSPTPACLAYSSNLAKYLALPPALVSAEVTAGEIRSYTFRVRVAQTGESGRDIVSVLSGNTVDSSWKPYAACYGGHQFGSWAGQLGDGRAVTLGDLRTSDGNAWELQLKGSGITPYSRFADGKAVLRSSLREFVCSEAMAALGVPTTRALALLSTGESVGRDEFYNGQLKWEPGAIVARAAPSFLRFGSLEIAKANRNKKLFNAIIDYLMEHFYPELKGISDRTQQLVSLLRLISDRTALMIAHWQSLGFTHGVMNTDNMSLLGLAIDYGPYGFMEGYSLDCIPNASDHSGRYKYGSQPAIGQWNIAALASLFVDDVPTADLQSVVNSFTDSFNGHFTRLLRAKLGLDPVDSSARDDLVSDCLQLLTKTEVDFTNFWFALASVDGADTDVPPLLHQVFMESGPAPEDVEYEQGLKRWLSDYRAALAAQESPCEVGRLRQLQANPRVIPRNFHMHAIIQCVEHSLQQSQPVCSDLDAYVTYVTAPYFSGSLSDYLALAATAVPRPLKASNQYWQLNSGPDRITESVLLYPHLLRKGVSVCSCSS